jgi:hypothetical protein
MATYVEDATVAFERAQNQLAAAERALAAFRAKRMYRVGGAWIALRGENRAAVRREEDELKFTTEEAQAERQRTLRRWSEARGPCGSTPPDSPNVTVNQFVKEFRK